jgi:hypothetical protein
MLHLFAAGEYEELLIVAERVVSIQGELEIERGSGKVRLYSNPNLQGGRSFPKVVGSLIALDNGVSIPVPQSPSEVGKRMSDALIRRTVMP